MKYEFDLTPEQAEALQATLDHYTALAREDAYDYQRGSQQHTFKANSAELLSGLSTQMFRQENASPITLTPIENNQTHLRSPEGQWIRDTDHLNRIRQELLTNPGLAEAKTSGRGRTSQEDFPGVSDEVWAEQRGVMQIMADDMGIDTPESYTTKRLIIDPLQQPDGVTSSRKYTEQQSIHPSRIQSALESRGFGDDSTYEYTASNRLTVRLTQAEDRVKIERIYSDGSPGIIYDSHRNDSEAPSLYIVFDDTERQATLEALGTLENVKGIDDIGQGDISTDRPPADEFLQAFAQGIEQLKRDNPMGIDPETGEPLPGGGAKERIERNLQALKDITEESRQLSDEANEKARQYWGSSKSETILGSLSGQYQERASTSTEYLEILAESAAQKPYDPELAALFDGIQGGTIEQLESSASRVSDYLFARDTVRSVNADRIIDPTAVTSAVSQPVNQGLGGDDLVNFIDNADFYSQVFSHAQQNGVELDGQKAFNFGQGISSAIEGDILTLERYGEPLGSSRGISSAGEVLAIRDDKTTGGIRQSVEASISGYNKAKKPQREPLENDWNDLYTRANQLLDSHGSDYVDVNGKTDNPNGSDFDLQIGRNAAGEIEITEGGMPDLSHVYKSHKTALGKSYPSPNFNHDVPDDLVTRLDSILAGEVDLNVTSEWQLYRERSQHGIFKPQDNSVSLNFRDHGQVGHSSLTLKHQGLDAEIVIGLNGSEAVTYPDFNAGSEIEDLIQSEQFEELVNASFRAEDFEYEHYPEFNDLSQGYGWNARIDTNLNALGVEYENPGLPSQIVNQLHKAHQESYEIIVGDYVPLDMASHMGYEETPPQNLKEHAIEYMGRGAAINNQMEMTFPASGDRKELTIIQDQGDITIRQAAPPEKNKAFDTVFSTKPAEYVDYELTPEQEADLILALQGEPNKGLSLDNPQVEASRSTDEPKASELGEIYQQVDTGLAHSEPSVDHGYWSEAARDNILDGIPQKDQLQAAGELDYVQALANKANELPYSEETMQAFLAVGGDTIEELQESIDKVKAPEIVVIDRSLSSKAELNGLFVKAYTHADFFGDDDAGMPITTEKLDNGVDIQVDTSEGEVWLMKDGKHLGSADMPILADGPDRKVMGFGRIENDGITPELQASIEHDMEVVRQCHDAGDLAISVSEPASEDKPGFFKGATQKLKDAITLVKPGSPEMEQAIYDELSDNPDMTMGDVMQYKRELLQSDSERTDRSQGGDSLGKSDDAQRGHEYHDETPHPDEVDFNNDLATTAHLDPEMPSNQQIADEFGFDLVETPPYESTVNGPAITEHEGTGHPDTPESMFDLVGDVMGNDYQPEPAEPDFIDGMDAVTARDMYGTSVEVTGSPQAVAENENTRFFKVVHSATESRGDFDPGTGIRKLDLGQGMTAMVEGQEMIVTQSDGKGNERLIYEQSADTAHLGGLGTEHSDRIEQVVKNTVWSKVVDDNAQIRSRVAARRSKAEMKPSPAQDKRAARLNRQQQTRTSRSKRSDGQMEFGI